MDNCSYDIYIVGVGGQGVLTIAELITEAAFKKNIAVNLYPTKGMAQRGGLVQAQLRLGRTTGGPSISAYGADLVIAMELSESLRAIRYIKPGAEFILYGCKWEPMEVMLGKAFYPPLADVWSEIEKAGGKVRYLDDSLPEYEGRPVRANLYLLGAIMSYTKLNTIISIGDIIAAISVRWPRAIDQNIFAFNAGFKANIYHKLPATL